MTERLHFHFSLSHIGEGNGNPLQCSCLENPRDGGAWWAAICGITQSQTRLEWLSSSNITWGKIWQKHWKKKEGNSYLSVLSGWDSDVGVRADRGRGIQVIGADVIQGVAETTAHRTAVIPAKDRQQQWLSIGCTTQSPVFPLNMYHVLGKIFLFFFLILWWKRLTFHFWKIILLRTEHKPENNLIKGLLRVSA